MIANLPLLFSDGNPISLAAMSVDQIERFIPFMVACSWGRETVGEIRKPNWWPHNVPFSHPFQRPSGRIPQDWKNRLRRLVQRCYDHHNCTFLLRFSAKIASYSRKRLIFVDNDDRTTSLVHKTTGELLVTLRNENLEYDQDREQPSPIMATDIYLCDDCDDHFDSIEALRAHERFCSDSGPKPTLPEEVSLERFLGALGLKSVNTSDDDCVEIVAQKTRKSLTRTVTERSVPFPFSSLAGRKAVKVIQDQNAAALRERIEKYCTVTPVSRQSTRLPHFPLRYKRPIDFWTRYHRFPEQRNKEMLDIKAQLLLMQCREFYVPVERMSNKKIDDYLERLTKIREEKRAAFISLTELSSPSVKEEMVNGRQDDPLKVTEVIDLCSDDESGTEENRDPAQWPRVVRGGAVLRRTSSPVEIIEDEGKRSNNTLPIIRSTPVILFSQSLANYQVISID